MLKLIYSDEQQDEPATLLFPADALRRLGAGLGPDPAMPGRVIGPDSIRCVEDALERVESGFARLRAHFSEDDDRPRAA
jgi:hypothetical protein